MRALLLAGVLFAASAAAQEAENIWRGKLVDWDCKQRDVAQACPVGPQTERFALSADGGVLLPLDRRGNQLAAEAVRDSGAAGNVPVTIEIEEQDDPGGMLKVQSVQVERQQEP